MGHFLRNEIQKKHGLFSHNIIRCEGERVRKRERENEKRTKTGLGRRNERERVGERGRE